jgi:Membrane bound O-acyl transferase family
MDLKRWKDSALLAVLFQLFLTTFGEGLVFVTAVISGRQVERLMDNPIFASASPSDFWGRRWNLLIHACLKNGVYKPLRRHVGASPAVATLAAFAASAAFHEWLLLACFCHFDNRYGMTTLFFLWQAVLVTVDGLIGNSKACRAFARLVPVGPLRTALVIMCGLPVAHLFIDSCK